MNYPVIIGYTVSRKIQRGGYYHQNVGRKTIFLRIQRDGCQMNCEMITILNNLYNLR